MELQHIDRVVYLDSVPVDFKQLQDAVKQFFALRDFCLLLHTPENLQSEPIRTQVDFDRAVKTGVRVYIDTGEHHYPWTSLQTLKSSCQTGSCLIEDSVIESELCLISEPTQVDKATQTDDYLELLPYLRKAVREALLLLQRQYQFTVKCSKCRNIRLEKVIRVCVPCGQYLCEDCEEGHDGSHPIRYVRRRIDL